MNVLPVSDMDSSRRREDILRELNLFPLWKQRAPSMPVPSDVMPIVDINVPVARHVKQETLAEEILADIETLDWTGLKKRVKTCTACSLRAGCTQTVFGTGDEKADWLFIGSWPTEDDDIQGQPFAGQAGQLLDNMLAAIKLKRGANVYLTNVVKCSGSIRRGPQPEQIAECAGYLNGQIQLLQPKLIIVLGHAAATALLGEDREWDTLSGKLHEYRCNATGQSQVVIPLIITHHPIALLLSPQFKAQTWRDLCLARDTMLGLARDSMLENKAGD